MAMSEERLCGHCSAPLVRHHGEQPSKWLQRRFCGMTCARRFRGVRLRKEVPDTKACAFCHKPFTRPPHTADWLWERRQCCSNSCAAKARHVRQKAANANVIGKARNGWQKASERHRAAELDPVAVRPIPAGPKFATVEEFVAFHGTEKLRAGMPQYSAANDPMAGIPVHPMSLGGGRVGGGRR